MNSLIKKCSTGNMMKIREKINGAVLMQVRERLT
jgi:hypothetical protein